MFYRAKHARQMAQRLKLGLTGIAALSTALIGIGVAATSANATTLTCTNVANALVSPFGCGGLQSGTLDLAHASNFYNGLVTANADSSTATEDWTAFAVVPPSVIPATPGGHITGGPGGFGEYVAMDTPGGNIPSFTVTAAGSGSGTACTGTTGGVPNNTVGDTYANITPCAGAKFTAGTNDLCLSVEDAANVPGTNGKLRWWTVLRSCNTNGTFTYGTPTAPGTVTDGHFNAYQAWAPMGPGNSGFLMNNVWLRQHHSNVPYILDITGNGGSGTATQAYPQHSSGTDSAVPWEEWNIIGCTAPASLLNVSSPYVNCP